MKFSMSGGHSARGARLFWRGLAGVQSGVLGGLAMAGWFLLASAMLKQPLWTVPNLLGSLVSEGLLMRQGFGHGAVAGLAAVLFLGGTTGALFALATSRVRSRRRLVLLGMLAGLVGFYFSNALVFRRLGALAWVYTSPRSLLVAHLLFGAVLGTLPLEPEGAAEAESAGKGQS